MRSIQSPTSTHFQSVQNPFENNCSSGLSFVGNAKNNNILDIANSFLSSPLMKQLASASNSQNQKSDVENCMKNSRIDRHQPNIEPTISRNSNYSRLGRKPSLDEQNHDSAIVLESNSILNKYREDLINSRYSSKREKN